MSDRDDDSVEMSEEIATENPPKTEDNQPVKPTEDSESSEKNAESDEMGLVKSKFRKLKEKKVEKEEVDVEIPEGDGSFMCGVVEGFYGRPWTTGQRKELFRRMKTMGMNTYLYGPKDDYKHRLYWRDLYSEDETTLLKLLIDSAAEFDVLFIYAISPGLDMSFASTKELEYLKSKLLQVQSLGCKAFALLFDDIDPILSAMDKTEYASAASAQAGVTNQMFEVLGGPKFLFCPTEYCSSMAVPDVANSKYLETIGKELNQEISIMWTGPKVVSKHITVESIKQLTKIIRRKVTIWDNIHANDYDPKRMFLGPYKGRSTDLIPLLSGVLTNPNCEFESNFIAMHTLASWWKSHITQMEKKDLEPGSTTERDKKLKEEIGTEEKRMTEPDAAELLPAATTDVVKNEKEVLTDPGPTAVPEDCGVCREEDSNRESTIKKEDAVSREPDKESDKPAEADGSEGAGNAASHASSGVSSLVGSDDSDTDSDYSSHEDYYAESRRSVLPSFDHGAYDPTGALKEAVKSWLPFFSTSHIPLGKPIARSGPPLGMLSQCDMGLISSSTMGPLSSTTRALPSDPITSTPMPSFADDGSKPSAGVKSECEEHKEDGVADVGVLDEEGKPHASDVEMSAATPSVTPLDTVGTSEEANAEAEDVKMRSDSDYDMKLLAAAPEQEEKRVESMGDAGENEEKSMESNTLMETEDEEPMQTEADHDSDVSMATNNSTEEKKTEKDGHEDRETMASISASSVTLATPPHDSSSPDQTPEKVTQSLQDRVSSDDTLEMPLQFKIEPMTLEDVELAVELFYLPYEHGQFGRDMVQDFLWLQSNIRDSVMPPNASKAAKNESMDKAMEWMERAIKFEDSCSSIRTMCSKLITCSNRALLYDLFPYFWDMKGVVSMLSTYVKWMGQFYLRHQPAITPEPPGTSSNSPKPVSSNSTPVSISSSQTVPPVLPAAVWLGNDPEPWVFRGGLSGEFQRLLPIAMANDLFCQAIPCSPPATSTTYTIRPYLIADERAVYNICLTTGNDGTDFADDFTGFEDLPGQWLAGGLLTLSPEYCFVVEDDSGICGYLVGTADAKAFWKKFSLAMWPELKEQYSPRKEEEVGEEVKRFFDEICGEEEPDSYAVDDLYTSHPAYMQIAVHRRVTDPTIAKSMTVCMLSALKSHGIHGAHTTVRSSDCYMPDLYCRLGFRQIRPFDVPTPSYPCSMDSKDDTIIVFGRNF